MYSFPLQFKIRKEALTGLGQIYKRNMQKDDADKTTIEKIAWIKNKVLHAYYQNALDDKYDILIFSCP